MGKDFAEIFRAEAREVPAATEPPALPKCRWILYSIASLAFFVVVLLALGALIPIERPAAANATIQKVSRGIMVVLASESPDGQLRIGDEVSIEMMPGSPLHGRVTSRKEHAETGGGSGLVLELSSSVGFCTDTACPYGPGGEISILFTFERSLLSFLLAPAPLPAEPMGGASTSRGHN